MIGGTINIWNEQPTKTFEDESELLFNGGAGEQRPAGGHLKEDATYTPHVDVRWVLRGSQEYIGRPIPENMRQESSIVFRQP